MPVGTSQPLTVGDQEENSYGQVIAGFYTLVIMALCIWTIDVSALTISVFCGDWLSMGWGDRNSW